VAELLNEAGLATLLVDLLTPEEEMTDVRTARLRFDIRLLAQRLVEVTDWLRERAETRGLRVGYFGASTGAAAALVAAAIRPEAVGAIVSRGGRPDLAGRALSLVRAPTLLIVGGEDGVVIEPEPRGARRAARGGDAGDRPGRDPSLRGARRAGRGRPPGARVVRAAPRGGARARRGLTQTGGVR